MGSPESDAPGELERPGARLQRKLMNVEKRGEWDWFENPFVNTRELNGLRIMMALLNNWDLTDVNNSIYATGGQRGMS